MHIFSPLLWDIEPSPELYEALNEINTSLRFAKVVWTGSHVLASVDVSASNLSSTELIRACGNLGEIADAYDDELVERFGGSVMFEGETTTVGTDPPPGYL